MREKDDINVNNEIIAKEVRVVNSSGEQIGIFKTRDALNLAFEQGLDLVEINSTSLPPVCKIIDYGKYRYEAQKKNQENKKKNKIAQLKEMILRPNIDVHDYMFKVKHMKEFISKGNKVRVVMKFKGREISHFELGENVLNRVMEDMKDVIEVDVLPKMDGRNMFMIMSPK